MTSPQQRVALRAEPRPILGKKVRFLRRAGLTPANLFGRNQESVTLQVETRALERALALGGGHTLLDLSIDGAGRPRSVLVRGLQRHPVTRAILHVNLYQVDVDRSTRTDIPIHLVGDAPAATLRDVQVLQVLHSLEVEGLPGDLPNAVEVDVSSLAEPDQAMLVRDIPLPDGITARADPDRLVVHAVRSRVAAEGDVEETAEETEDPAADA